MRRDGWWWEAAYLVGFVVLTAGLAAGGPLLRLDVAVARWSESHRPDAADTVARTLNLLGQGTPLLVACLLLAAWLALRIRSVRPLVYVLAAAAMLIPTVLALKLVTSRGAPSSELPLTQTVRLFGPLPPGEYAAGFPSGHVVNTVVWYGVLLLLATALLRAYGRGDPPRPVRLLVRVAPPVIVLCTTTYLSFHWLTDGLAGLALGLLIDRLLRRVRMLP